MPKTILKSVLEQLPKIIVQDVLAKLPKVFKKEIGFTPPGLTYPSQKENAQHLCRAF